MSTTTAQNKLSVNIMLGVNKSIGKDILTYHTLTNNRGAVYYYTREKYRYPFNSIKINYSYRPTNNFEFGLQSGVYLFYLQSYGADHSLGIEPKTF